mmetsp:Transcript_4109/g.12508  ORF Transcript_4109/g.12508 Transcript_4109/m.12508 type:complete len:127 (-) Transcript_4109:2358-2738(-)
MQTAERVSIHRPLLHHAQLTKTLLEPKPMPRLDSMLRSLQHRGIWKYYVLYENVPILRVLDPWPCVRVILQAPCAIPSEALVSLPVLVPVLCVHFQPCVRLEIFFRGMIKCWTHQMILIWRQLFSS